MSASRSSDVAVIGLGAMGSAAAYQLARRGQKVLGIDQFGPAHDQGSSHGKSRIIRQAYFEGEAYVPLLLRAYELWEELQRECDQQLLTITGGLFLGPRDGRTVAGSLASAARHGLAYEVLDAAEVRRRFPPFCPPEHFAALYEVKAGVLNPEGSVAAALATAEQRGADLHFHERVEAIEPHPGESGVTIVTSRGTYACSRAIVTAGPWAGSLLADLNLPLSVERVIMHWFRPIGHPELFLPGRFPVHIWQLDNGLQFYGFPAMEGPDGGVKVAFHTHHRTPCTPETIDRTVHEHEIAALRAVMATYIPQLNGDHLDARTCMYTMTPDEHFIVDLHPRHPGIVLAAGFSGHGFKFASVIGEVLADLASQGTTRHDIRMFAASRFKGTREEQSNAKVG